jgi:hypothetical protein
MPTVGKPTGPTVKKTPRCKPYLIISHTVTRQTTVFVYHDSLLLATITEIQMTVLCLRVSSHPIVNYLPRRSTERTA